jgi:alpha-L-rhamnosidase
LSVTVAPRFSWVVVDEDPDEVQSAFEIVVKDASGTVVGSSGKIKSSQQSHLRQRIDPLKSDQTYTWSVRTWDRQGRRGPFTRPATFSTGLLDEDWAASWVRRPGIPVDAYEDFSLLRTERALSSSPIVRARAYVAAGQQYELHVNGTPVRVGSSFAYPDEQYYDAIDITHEVAARRVNVFGLVTHWSGPGQGRPASVPGAIARITVDHADGTREVITTDASWRAAPGPWVQGHQRNEEGDFVEHVDGRRDPVGWDTAGFGDSTWVPVEVLGAHPVAPFTHLVPARTAIVESTLRPRTIHQLATGETVADFGAVVAASPVVVLADGVDGRAVKIVAGDLLDADGHVSTTTGNQGTDMHWDYDERGGDQTFRPFGYLAFRYLEIAGAGHALTADDVQVATRHAGVDTHAASFDSSNTTLNAVWELAQHSLLYSMQEQFLDTPTREKGQFLADAYNESTGTMRAFGERGLTEQAIRDFARSQARYWPDGRVNAVYPNGDGARDIPDFTEMYVEWLWRVYVDTGDRDFLNEYYGVAKRISDYLAAAIDPATGLVTNLPGGEGDYASGIVDWPRAMRYGYDMDTAARTTVNIRAYQVFDRVATMATALTGNEDDAKQARARADALKRAIQARLTRPDGVFVDGLRADGTQSPHASQHASVFALTAGVVPDAQRGDVLAHVVALGTAMGPMTADTLVRALHESGDDRAMLAALTDAHRPGWAQILDRGATFTWESWNARDVPGDSESHGWGATVLATIQADVLGVSIAEPGAARVDIRVPDVPAMSVRGRVPTQRGPVTVAWKRTGSDVSLAIDVPANMRATVHRPGASTLTVGSGHYEFGAGHHAHRGRGYWVAVGVLVVLALASLSLVWFRVRSVSRR